MTAGSEVGKKKAKPKGGSPCTQRGKAKMRLNAQKHKLFAKAEVSHESSPRVQDLQAAYCKDVTNIEELSCLRRLAVVQAHIEDIRRVRTAVWNEALQTAHACLDEMSDLTVFKPQTENPSVRKMRLALDLPEEVPDPVLEFVPERVRCIALDKVSSKLLTLAGYERRAQGRRRKIMREIMRIRVDEKWKDA